MVERGSCRSGNVSSSERAGEGPWEGNVVFSWLGPRLRVPHLAVRVDIVRGGGRVDGIVIAAVFLVEEQHLRVKAEIQQAVQRALDVADVPGLIADDGIDEGAYSATALRATADRDLARASTSRNSEFIPPP
jgi:hypothetical protein